MIGRAQGQVTPGRAVIGGRAGGQQHEGAARPSGRHRGGVGKDRLCLKISFLEAAEQGEI